VSLHFLKSILGLCSIKGLAMNPNKSACHPLLGRGVATVGMRRNNLARLITSVVFALCWSCLEAVPPDAVNHSASGNLWAHHNLVAWCIVPFDTEKRGPEQRAQMLEKLGFKNFAYDWQRTDVPTLDAEIEALRRHGINLLAWWFPFNAEERRRHWRSLSDMTSIRSSGLCSHCPT
jgi:hypothetical protein